MAAWGEVVFTCMPSFFAHVHEAVRPVQRQAVQHVPAQQGFQPQKALLAQIGVLEVVLHVVDAPYALDFITEIVAVGRTGQEQAVVAVLGSQREIIVLSGCMFSFPRIMNMPKWSQLKKSSLILENGIPSNSWRGCSTVRWANWRQSWASP